MLFPVRICGRIIAVAAVLCAMVSCGGNRAEDIALPYAKKRCRLPEEQWASFSQAQWDAFSVFLWLQERDTVYDTVRICENETDTVVVVISQQVLSDEQQRWLEDEFEATQNYLSLISRKREYEQVNLPELQWKEIRFCPKGMGENDSLTLHLYFKEAAFENGLNPLVLTLYQDSGSMPVPPEIFFQEGGIWAVLGENPATECVECDTALSDTLAFSPAITYNHLLYAVNLLVGDMYTSPRRLAVIGQGENVLTVESLVLQRPDLFRAAYLQLPSRLDSTACNPAWSLALLPDKNDYPAILMTPQEDQYFLTAFFQENSGRKCGKKPVLLYNASVDGAASMHPVWRFLLYQIL